MTLRKIVHILPFSVLAMAIYSVLPYPRWTGVFNVLSNTTVWWVVNWGILLLYFNLYLKTSFASRSIIWLPVKIYVIWVLISIIRGPFVAINYWDYKSLIDDASALMLGLCAFVCVSPRLLQQVFHRYIQYAIPAFVLIGILILPSAYGFYLAPLQLFIFFLPQMKLKFKIIIIALCGLILVVDSGARSNVIKFAVPFFFLFIYYCRNAISSKLLNLVRVILLILPIILFSLAVTDVFNVFKISDYVGGTHTETTVDANGQVVVSDLTEDTRTFIYQEVIASAVKYHYWLFGRTPARGNETVLFADLKEISGRAERYSNEVAICNIFTWLGLIGVILYGWVFARASYLAINRSKNIYIKMIGLFVAFRWVYAWVEDINNFSLNYWFVWVMIGMCIAPQFRNMSNQQLFDWVAGIFENKKKRQIIYN